MSAPMIALSTRFQAMKVKDIPVKMGVPASDARLDEQFQHALFIDPSLDKDKLQAEEIYDMLFRLKSALTLLAFIASNTL